MAVTVGIDVSKHTLEWAFGPEEKIQHTRNEPRPIASLVQRLVQLDAERIVVESTGGYERRVVQKLAEAGLPVVVVNPRRVRSFGEGMGFLAKTDAIDARLLALFGEKAQPPIRPMNHDYIMGHLIQCFQNLKLLLKNSIISLSSG